MVNSFECLFSTETTGGHREACTQVFVSEEQRNSTADLEGAATKTKHESLSQRALLPLAPPILTWHVSASCQTTILHTLDTLRGRDTLYHLWVCCVVPEGGAPGGFETNTALL